MPYKSEAASGRAHSFRRFSGSQGASGLAPFADDGMTLMLSSPSAAPLPEAPHLTDAQFHFFGRLAYQHAGIVIADFKRSMVLRRILRRVKTLDLKTVDEYCRLLTGPAGSAEIEPLINVLTTNKTAFFREAHHFEHLRETALPQIFQRKRDDGSARVRLWSAGCSTGEEAWSIAISAQDALVRLPSAMQRSIDLKVLATDIDTEVVHRAKSGHYEPSDLAPLSTRVQDRYFLPDRTGSTGREVAPELKRLVTFKPLNLHDEWPFQGPFDVIFCRNVVIYFDREAQRRLYDRFADMLTIKGLLYCGHSESLHSLSDRFRPIGRSVYERIA